MHLNISTVQILIKKWFTHKPYIGICLVIGHYVTEEAKK